MNIDARFATKLDAIQDAPQPLRKALLENFLPKSLSASLSTPRSFQPQTKDRQPLFWR